VTNARMMRQWKAGTQTQSFVSDVTAISFDRMRSHAIACNRMGYGIGTDFIYYFFAFLKKEEMRSGTHFTQQNMFLLFTVVVPNVFLPGGIVGSGTVV